MAEKIKIYSNDKPITNEEFDAFLKANMDFIKKITPLNPTISKDDEWNDSIYDKYDTLEDVAE